MTRLETRLAELQILAAEKQQVLEIYVPGRGGLRRNAFDQDPMFRLVPPGHAIRPVTSLPDGWWERVRMPLEIAKTL